MSHRIATNMRSPKVIFSLTILVAIAFGLFARGGSTTAPESMTRTISCKNNFWKDSSFYKGDVSGCPDLIEYLFKPAYVNEKNSELVLRFITLPAGKFGSAMRNSGWVITRED